MPGRLFDVGGHRLHISCMGSGTPAVVLEAGLGEPGVMMAGWIQPGVTTSTRVCVYDRAGKGWSEPARSPQDGFAVAADLHSLLREAHIAGPYVLAGHSSGGVYVRVFAERYPEEVAGMVLLDSQSPYALAQLPGYARFYRGFRTATGLFPSLARLGVMRLFYSSAAKGAMDGWLPLQDKMAALSTNSIHRVEQHATHTSLIEDRSDSAISIQAILDVVAAVRSGLPLQACETRKSE